jgi:hypothetical protein
VLRRVMWKARIRAGEICAGKGQALLGDAALCFYWAERDIQESEDQALNMQRFLSTLTSLLDLYAAPGRGGSRQTRGKVLDHCTQLVHHMLDALERQKQTPPNDSPPPDDSLLARQGHDLIKWLSASLSLAAPGGSENAGAEKFTSNGSLTVEVPASSFGAEPAHSPAISARGQQQRSMSFSGGDGIAFGGVAGGGQAEMGEAMSTGRVTRLALFLHAWQVAQAHEVQAAGMPLDALRELLHLPSDESSSRQTQFAPKVATLLAAFSPKAGAGLVLAAAKAQGFVSPSAAIPSPGGWGGRTADGTAGLGRVCFLPSSYHSVNAKLAILQVEKMMSASRTVGGASCAAHIVPDAIILALQCLLTFKKQRAARGTPGQQRGRGRSRLVADYSSADITAMFSPQSSVASKRRRELASDDLGELSSPSVRRRVPATPDPVGQPALSLFAITPARDEAQARAFGASGLGELEGEEDSLLSQHKLHHSVDWHIEVCVTCMTRVWARLGACVYCAWMSCVYVRGCCEMFE